MKQLFYCCADPSPERYAVACRLVRYLALQGVARKAAVVEFSKPLDDGGATLFVVAARGLGSIEHAYVGAFVPVHLHAHDTCAGADDFMVSGGPPAIEAGALTVRLSQVREWCAATHTGRTG